jgi:hypothetical protein
LAASTESAVNPNYGGIHRAGADEGARCALRHGSGDSGIEIIVPRHVIAKITAVKRAVAEADILIEWRCAYPHRQA